MFLKAKSKMINIAADMVITVALIIFITYIMILLTSLFSLLISYIITILGFLMLALIYYFIFQTFIYQKFGKPVTKYLILNRKKFRNKYTINLNVLGFLRGKESNIQTIKQINASFYEILKKIDLNKLNDTATLEFNTWIITEKDKQLMKSYGFNVVEDNRNKKRIVLKIIYYLAHKRAINFRDKKWYLVSFNKKQLEKVRGDFFEET